jgi:hypothetical protein
MKRSLIAAGGLLLAGVVVAGGAGAAAGGRGDGARPGANARAIHVIEHAVDDTITHSGGGGDAVGDILTFHNRVFDRTDTTQVGTDNGFCIRTVFTADTSTWECTWTTTLANGSLTVQGPFFETPLADSTLAITGGTGSFRRARGQMLLHALNPTEFAFAFHVVR